VSRKHHISQDANRAIDELVEQRDKVERLPDSDRKFNLLDRIDSKLEELQCGPECSFCGEAAFTGDDDDENPSDPIIQRIANQFQILPQMNKKVIAGVLIVASIAITVIAIKMWRKASPAVTEGK
jgi:hypothetical protein